MRQTTEADPNIPINHDHSSNHQPHSKTPFSNNVELTDSKPTLDLDPSVKVVVRIRPSNTDGREGDGTVKKISPDTLCVGDRQFIYNSVFDSKSNQEDIFQTVGIPLVKNAIAGYNTSVLSYGQSGSGKTYTMWGPPSAMFEEPSPQSQKGIVPRIFQMLFSELESERIYNEQIGDLLDSTQRNLEMKDGFKHAFNIENLTEEYVTSYDDVTQILIKGLSSRKVGATSLNSKSSRSHIIFTFVIESWCKGISSSGFSSSKTSRISLIDLAGLYRNKVDDAGKQHLRENRNVKKSLSKLGHLVDALTKKTRSGKAAQIPNRDSCLTHLLQESLGGNAKLSIICSISPDNKDNGETLHTLRFGQRVRSIRNEPVINEINEDDVNDLSDKIRQLKQEELIRAKADGHSSFGSINELFQGHNVRESLNQLRVSLNRSLLLPHIDNSTDEEVHVDEEDIRQLRQQIDELYNSCEENPKEISVSEDCVQYYSVDDSCDTDKISGEKEEICSGEMSSRLCHEDSVVSGNTLYASVDDLESISSASRAIKSTFRDSISVSSCYRSPILEEPPLSESPKIRSTKRKSQMSLSSSCLGSWNNVAVENLSSNEDVLGQPFIQGDHLRSSLRSSKVLPGPTESLAASLQRGLQIIDYHQQNSALTKSSVSFSFGRSILTCCPETDMGEKSSIDGRTPNLLCESCRKKISDQDSSEVEDSLKPSIDTDKVPKDLETVMAQSILREKELKNVCKEQAARIEELNRLVSGFMTLVYYVSDLDFTLLTMWICPGGEKLKGEKELDSVIVYESNKQTKHEESNNSQKDENKVFSSDGNFLRQSFSSYYREEKCEIKEVQEELTQRVSSFDATEKEELLKEIQNLRCKVRLYGDAPLKSPQTN
ncbi:putative plus-end-directed kinesin ATPase [Lupinus albus]|uniref:Putative plus-end-directed kinesin ATPase n=1 Tax=Lupinus albus TaxID=3870 RepID=A0A6A4N0K4_LUPAL|nr:putative plus-end-directed kinesin ATPase [Lupinus albus]